VELLEAAVAAAAAEREAGSLIANVFDVRRDHLLGRLGLVSSRLLKSHRRELRASAKAAQQPLLAANNNRDAARAGKRAGATSTTEHVGAAAGSAVVAAAAMAEVDSPTAPLHPKPLWPVVNLSLALLSPSRVSC
jgi:hypothetical protein